jgi:hypothetical protein
MATTAAQVPARECAKIHQDLTNDKKMSARGAFNSRADVNLRFQAIPSALANKRGGYG